MIPAPNRLLQLTQLAQYKSPVTDLPTCHQPQPALSILAKFVYFRPDQTELPPPPPVPKRSAFQLVSVSCWRPPMGITPHGHSFNCSAKTIGGGGLLTQSQQDSLLSADFTCVYQQPVSIKKGHHLKTTEDHNCPKASNVY